MPTGPSIVSAGKRLASGRQPPRLRTPSGTPAHPEQGFRACRGILRLVCAFGVERLEVATARARGLLSRGESRACGSIDAGLSNPPTDIPWFPGARDEASPTTCEQRCWSDKTEQTDSQTPHRQQLKAEIDNIGNYVNPHKSKNSVRLSHFHLILYDVGQ